MTSKSVSGLVSGEAVATSWPTAESDHCFAHAGGVYDDSAQRPAAALVLQEALSDLMFCSMLWPRSMTHALLAVQQLDDAVLCMQVERLLAQPAGSEAAFGAQEAAMLVWALAVLHELQPAVWTALLDIIAAAPEDALDEASGCISPVAMMRAGLVSSVH